MKLLNDIIQALYQEYMLLTWRDYSEIIFFSIATYTFTMWLASDKKKNLLLPFYGYCITLFSSFMLNISGITTFLLWYTPAIGATFIILHQTTLQRNFITTSLQPSTTPLANTSWIEEIIRASLLAINKHKDIIFIIERSHLIHDYMTTRYTLNAECSALLLDTLLEQTPSLQPLHFWIKSSGILVAHNVHWNLHESLILQESSPEKYPEWLAHALCVTAKSDVIVLAATHMQRNFTLIMSGKQITHLSPTHTTTLLHQLIQGETPHEIIPHQKTTPFEQHSKN